MNPKAICCIAIPIVANLSAAPVPSEYITYLKQTQLSSGVAQVVDLVGGNNQVHYGAPSGGALPSPLPIEVGGARFDIYSKLNKAPFTTFLLDTTVVGVKVRASIVIDTEDPYGKSNPLVSYANPAFVPSTGKPLPADEAYTVRRTRVDRPFKVYVTTSGLSPLATDPDVCKSVSFRRQVLTYGTNVTGEGVSLSPAVYGTTPQSSFTVNATVFGEYTTQVPSATIGSTRGEEIFSVWSLSSSPTGTATIPPNRLASHRIQICPMTSGSIAGITEGQKVRFMMPKITFNTKNAYPESDTYARIYKGPKRADASGARISGSGKVNTGTNPEDFLTTSSDDINSLITSDGLWTIELVTYVKCFGDTLCIASTTVDVDRKIKANGNFTTIE